MNSQMVVKNLLISYLAIAGEGRCSLLFLHGWRSDSQIWLPVIKEIKNSDCKIYAIDLSGFGASQTPPQAWSVGDYADLVSEFIEKLNLENVIVVGHSFGGRVGIKLASAHPNSVEKLVLVDSAGFVTQRSKKRVMELGAKLVKPLFLPKFMHGLRRKIYKVIGADDYVATPWLTETFIKIKEEDLSEEMKRIACPTLIIWGEEDSETPPSFGEKMHQLIPNSKLQILKNAGHFSFLDQSGEFAKELKVFLDAKSL